MNPRHTFTKSTHLENEYPIDAKVCPEKKTIQTLSNSNHRVHRRSGHAVPRAHLRGHSADHFHPSRCEGRPAGPCYLRRRPLTRPHTCRPAHPPQPTRPRPPRPHSSLVRHAAENRRLVRSSSPPSPPPPSPPGAHRDNHSTRSTNLVTSRLQFTN